jgi:hypothetical protein
MLQTGLAYSECNINKFALIYLAYHPGLCYSFRVVTEWCSIHVHFSAEEEIGDQKS